MCTADEALEKTREEMLKQQSGIVESRERADLQSKRYEVCLVLFIDQFL